MSSKHTPTIVEIIADGLDALTDGRGYGIEHHKATLLANAAPALLEIVREFLSMTLSEHSAICSSHIRIGKTGRKVKGCNCIMGKARTVIAKAVPESASPPTRKGERADE